MSVFRRGFFCTAIAAAMLLSNIPCHASAPDVSAQSYVLMDAESGRVLLCRGETDELPIASTTKIMTALVAMERCRPDDAAAVRREHLCEGSSMYLAEGETLDFEALLYGLMLSSGNDAAECIAGNLGGRESFVRAMNEKAAELGLSHTSFANPSGLDEAGHHSCALDMAKLMAYAMKQPLFFQIASTKTASAGARSLQNHNKLLGALEGCVGGKTGYTGAAGRTLVTCAERNGLRLVAVTLHDSNDWQDHTALYEYGFSTYRRVNSIARGSVCAFSAVRGGELCGVELCAAKSITVPVANGEEAVLRVEAVNSVRAPVEKGQTVGYAVVLINGVELGRTELCAVNSISEAVDRSEPSAWSKFVGLFARR